jgi:thymidylate kinase
MRNVDPQLDQKFVNHPVRWAFTYETHRLLGLDELINTDLVENYNGNPDRQIIVDGMYSSRHVYANYLKHQEWITDREFTILDKLYKRLFTEPKVIIYLFGTFDNNFQRMSGGSGGDNKYTEEEFKKLHYQFEWVFDTNNCQIPIYKVSVEDDLESIVGNIREILEKVDIILNF